MISGRSSTFLALQITSLPVPSLHILQTYLYIQIPLSCVLIPNQNSCSIQRVLQGCPWQLALAGSWREACFPLLIISQYQLQTPCSSSAVLGHLHCAQTPVPFLLCSSPMSSLWDKCAGIARLQWINYIYPFTWPEFLPTCPNPSQEGALWSSAEKAALQ